MAKLPDIDIDTASSFNPLSIFPTVRIASRVHNDRLMKHPVCTYFQNIPIDPVSKLSAIPYEEADDLGYFGIDMLHLTLLDAFKSKAQIREILRLPPDWGLLEDKSVVEKLFQLGKHYDTVSRIKPRSIQALADCIAIIRPGKLKLLDQYIADPVATRVKLYTIERGSDYKLAHSVAYSLNIVLQMYTISNKISDNLFTF